MIRRRRAGRPASLLALLCAVVLFAAGCAPMLPTDGPVGTSEPEQGAEAGGLPDPVPPRPQMGPESIVEGFMQAGVGWQDDYSVAREYMDADAARQWEPGERTVIYSSDPTTLAAGDDTYTVQLEVDSVVDANGIRTHYPQDQTDEFEFTVEEVDGQWRITEAPSGKLLDITQFAGAYQERTLYFYDPQEQYAVPDLRWFVDRPAQPSEIMSTLLEGPADYLEPAVHSAFPEGTSLERTAVPVDDAVASVDLSPDHVAGADEQERQLMQHQADLALGQVDGIDQVDVTVGESELELPEEGDAEPLEISVNPAVSSTLVGVLDETLMHVEGQNELSISGLPDISDLDPQKPAMPDVAARVYAFLDGEAEELYHLRPERDPDLVYEGEELIRPSMDNFGWTWTVDNGGDNASVRSVAYDESLEPSQSEVSADWLEDREVTSLRVAQDGTRAAMVVDDGGERRLQIAGIIRDSDGVPQGLGEPLLVQTSVELEEVRWESSTSLVVWANAEDDSMQIEQIGLDGEATELNSVLAGLQNVAVGEGEGQIYAETVDNPQYAPVGDTQWHPQEMSIRDLAYAG